MKSAKLFYLTIFLLTSFVSSSVPAGPAKFERRQQETIKFSSGDSFCLVNVNGPVRISAWDREECEIVAVKTASGDLTAEDAERWFEKVNVEVKKVAGGVEVATKYPDKFFDSWPDFGESEKPDAFDEELGVTGTWFARLVSFLSKLPEAFSELVDEKYPVEVAYEVKLPGLADVDITNVNGEIEISGLKGHLNSTIVNGTIRLTGLDGRLEATAVSGEIVADNPGGSVELNTVNGSLSVSVAEVERLKTVECNTVNGNITFRLPANSQAKLDLSALNGGVEIDEAFNFKGKIGRRTVSGELTGPGGPHIEANALNGRIEIKIL